ncbi:hypothetical protein PI126_g11791 [Phytophthora idaei]|nr:hypothetical protein PI126_g11791 [Phytophthora idaei]
MHASGDWSLCPVRALKQIEAARRQLGATTSEHLCVELSSKDVAAALKQVAMKVGVPPSNYATHSLRIGGAMALFDGRVDSLAIKLLGRKVVKNTCKRDRVQFLRAWDTNKEGAEVLVRQQHKRTKGAREEEEAIRTKGCMFRLLNILFSDSFFTSFLVTRRQLHRNALDQGSGFTLRQTSALPVEPIQELKQLREEYIQKGTDATEVGQALAKRTEKELMLKEQIDLLEFEVLNGI